MAIKLPTSAVTFGADANESETLYIEANENLIYSVENIKGGSAADYKLTPMGDGWLFHIQALEWQSDSPTEDIEKVVFNDGTSTAELTVTTRMSPSGALWFKNNYIEFAPNETEKRVFFEVVGIEPNTTITGDFDNSNTPNLRHISTSPLTDVEGKRKDGYIDVVMFPANGKTNVGYLYIEGKDEDGYTLKRNIQYIQRPQKVFPIWKEEIASINAPNGSAEYTVVNTDSNKTIYKGRATSFAEKQIKIDLAKIVRPLLRSSFDFELGNNGAVKDETATLNFSLNVNGVPLCYYTAYDNYSYIFEFNHLNKSTILNNPVRPVYSAAHPFFISCLNVNDDKLKVNDYEAALERGVIHYGDDDDTLGDIVAQIGDSRLELKAVQWCGRYIIYYINSLGGLDLLLTEGNEEMTDAMTDGTITHPQTMTGFEKSRYLRKISRRLKLHTDWLTNEESMRMSELLESARVWVLDTVKWEVHPVLLTDTSMTYKTFENQGRQLVSYDLNVEFSHSFERR